MPKLDSELNDACRSITGCLRPTNVEELYLLAGIAPPDIRRYVCARVAKKKQETNAAHSLHGQVPAERRLKRECFLSSVRPADFPAKVIRCSEWQHRQNLASHNCAVNLDESLAKGHTSPEQRREWRCLNRLRTGVACSKEQRKRWKYINGDTTCECGQAPETTKHMLECPLLAHPCTLDDLQKFNENARKCVDKLKNAGENTKMKKKRNTMTIISPIPNNKPHETLALSWLCPGTVLALLFPGCGLLSRNFLCSCCCLPTPPCLFGGVLPYFEVTGHPVPVSSLGFKCPDCFIWNCSYIVYTSKMKGPSRDNCLRYYYL